MVNFVGAMVNFEEGMGNFEEGMGNFMGGMEKRNSVETPNALAVSQVRVTPSNLPHHYDINRQRQYPMYPPMGTLGPYGNNWFKEEYKNNYRNVDK